MTKFYNTCQLTDDHIYVDILELAILNVTADQFYSKRTFVYIIIIIIHSILSTSFLSFKALLDEHWSKLRHGHLLRPMA